MAAFAVETFSQALSNMLHLTDLIWTFTSAGVIFRDVSYSH